MGLSASLRLRRPCSQLISVGVTKICNERPVRTCRGRALDCRSAVCDTGGVPRQDVVGGRRRDTDCSTVGSGRRFAVNGCRDHQPPSFMGVDQSASGVHLAGLAAQSDEGGIIEISRALQVVAADHDVGEHALSNEFLAVAGIARVISLPSRLIDFYEVAGSRACISCMMPFARTDDPSVIAGDNVHVLINSMSLFSIFRIPPK